MSARPRLFAGALACALVAVPPAVPQASGSASQSPTSPAATPFGGQNTPLGIRVATLLRTSEAAGAHWGIAVTTSDGTPVFGWNEQQLFRPASTAKLFTTAAAMALLGPEHTVTTSISGALDRGTGVVAGDLTLLGGGDPSFGTTDLPFQEHPGPAVGPDALSFLADQVLALGVRRIQGDVIGDDTLFAREQPPEGWAAEDLVWGYGALPSALSIDDNQLELQIVSTDSQVGVEPMPADTSAQPPSVVLEQRVPWVQLTQNVKTLPNGTSPLHIGITFTSESPQAVRVFGTVPAGTPAVSEKIALQDPAAYAAAALKALLIARGVDVQGKARAVHITSDDARPYLQVWRDDPKSTEMLSEGESTCPVADTAGQASSTSSEGSILTSLHSAPLREDVVFTLKTSANLHAEIIMRQLAAKTLCPGTLAVQGAATMRRWLLQIGVPEHEFVLYDGSGLSAKDLVTPRAETTLLTYAAHQPWFAAWRAALPIGGVDGTLAGRFTSSAMRGRVLAKTGTLGESRALAGYVHCFSGRTLIFSILVDNHEPGSLADRATMDALVEGIAATN